MAMRTWLVLLIVLSVLPWGGCHYTHSAVAAVAAAVQAPAGRPPDVWCQLAAAYHKLGQKLRQGQ
jgi:hypothetical protein